ncbi:MAG: GIY-YIG nuclease family protein [Candidatus Kerfeldbacteria bacterium]|nr:GIY-YIG nuclease family protein [Candidatus Kerfeldbacteria bacterium]
MYSVYILECTDGTLYTGISTNVAERFAKHQAGKASRYTRSHQPVKIIYTEKAGTKSKALKREAQIKRMTRAEKIALCGKLV